MSEVYTQISDKTSSLKINQNHFQFKVPNPFDTDLQLVEIDLNEKQHEIDRV